MIASQPMFFAPPITAKQLYFQDKRRREWDEEKRETTLYLESLPWYSERRLQQIEDELMKLEERQRQLTDERRRLVKGRS